jgi:DNA-binding CsgD family transcriptional regulator
MAGKKQGTDNNEEIKELIKKQLVLNLYALNLPQGEIAKRLHMDTHAVNSFLKGIKKKQL